MHAIERSNLPIGTTTVLCRASDAASNTTSSSFSVLVRDTTAPVIGATANVTKGREPDPHGGAVPDSGGNGCSRSRLGDLQSRERSTFPTGTSSVTCTAKDAALNASTKSFTVTVQLSFAFGGLIVPRRPTREAPCRSSGNTCQAQRLSTPGRLFQSCASER